MASIGLQAGSRAEYSVSVGLGERLNGAFGASLQRAEQC